MSAIASSFSGVGMLVLLSTDSLAEPPSDALSAAFEPVSVAAQPLIRTRQAAAAVALAFAHPWPIQPTRFITAISSLEGGWDSPHLRRRTFAAFPRQFSISNTGP